MSRSTSGLFALLLSLSITGSAYGQSTVHSVRLSDGSGLYEYSLKGDQKKLLEMSQSSSGGTEVIAQALYQRSLYRLDDSSKTVSECGSASQLAHSTANWSCALILAGNKLLVGDVSGWAKSMDAIKKVVVPLLANQMHVAPQDVHVAELETVADFSKYFDFPSISVKRDVDQFSVPVDWIPSKDSSDSIQPFITATVNGHSLRMAIDTGTSGVIISHRDADLVGVSDIHQGWANTSQGVSTDLGVIKNLSVGGVHITNMPATITGAPVSILGIRGLQFLRAIRLHGNTLVSSDQGFKDACQTPLDMASWVEGSNNALLVPGTVNGDPFRFFLDTGNAWGIVRHAFGSPSDSDNAKPILLTVGNVAGKVMMAESRDEMQIGNVPVHLQDYRIVYSDQHKLFRYDIGGSYVHEHDLIIDFENGLMCIAESRNGG
jgi:hypothetical protein